MDSLRALCARTGLLACYFAGDQNHHVRSLAISHGIANGKLPMPVLARQIIGRALNGAEIKPAVVGEYKASLATLSKAQKIWLFPALAAALRSAPKEVDLEVPPPVALAVEEIIVRLGLERD
jgi:hypothetical protein